MSATAITRENITRDVAIQTIKTALRLRSGKAWSVTGGRGTAWGWIRVEAPPARRTGHWVQRPGTLGNPGDYDYVNTGEPDGNTTPEELKELAALLGLDVVHYQGESIPAGHDYWLEYIDRAQGRKPSILGKQYWD